MMSVPRSLLHIEFCQMLVLLAVVECGTAAAQGDEFELMGGGRLQGHWLNRDDPSHAVYEIRTMHGVRIVLDKTRILRAAPGVAAEQQYQEAVARYGDDGAGQWALAEWCRAQGLDQLRRQHLRRILELEPDHAGARQALGYAQVRGQWVTQEEFMREQGYVLYRGKWQLSQQVELAEAERRSDLAARQWYRQFLHWRHGGLMQRDPEVTAQIRDPLAVPGLAIMLRREELRPLKMLWIRALANTGTPEAFDLLVDVVLQETDMEVVHGCLDFLAEIHSPHVQRRFLETLKHANNHYVNRAGLALGRLGEKAAIDALIDALVTHHVLCVRARKNGEVDQVTVVPIKNLDVLSALTQLTATAGYRFDQHAWKQWRFLDNQQAYAETAASVDVRRGQ